MERILRFLVGEISGIEGCEILKNKAARRDQAATELRASQARN